MSKMTVGTKSFESQEFVWTEPEQISEKVEDFDPSEYIISEDYQNRHKGKGNKGLTDTEDGFLVNKSKCEDIAHYFITQANRGVASHNAVPAVTVAVLVNEAGDVENQYFIGGHGRAAGLMLARKGASNGMADDLHEEDDSVDNDGETDVKDVSGLLKKLRIRKFKCKNDRDMATLAGLENSDAQNGERLKAAERKTVIQEGLKDPAKAQYKDLAFAVKFLNDPSCRSTVNNTRKAMWKEGTTHYQQGVLNINGVPQKPSRPGSVALDTLNKTGKRLDTEFNSLGKLDIEDVDEDTYKGFEKLRSSWEKQRAKASRFLQDRNEETGKTEDEMLTQELIELEARIGYTAYQESLIDPEADGDDVANSQDGEGEGTDTDAENQDAIDETKDVATRILNETANTEDEDEDDDDDDDDDADEEEAETEEGKDVPYASRVGRAHFLAKQLKEMALKVRSHCEEHEIVVATDGLSNVEDATDSVIATLFEELKSANESA